MVCAWIVPRSLSRSRRAILQTASHQLPLPCRILCSTATLLDAFSMRQFHPGTESGHDHFFATFGKFGAATNNHTAEMLAEVRSRAAEGHLQYMELMFNPDGGAAAKLGRSLGWNDDLSKPCVTSFLSGGLPQIVADASAVP